MSNPDEYFVPDDGDPWQQQMKELEQQQEVEGMIPSSEHAPGQIKKPDVILDRRTSFDSGDPF